MFIVTEYAALRQIWFQMVSIYNLENVGRKLNLITLLTITLNNFACDIGRRKINRIEVIFFLIIFTGHDPLLLHD